MILDENINILITNYNIKFFKKLLNDDTLIIGNMLIDVNNLSKNSHYKVHIKCDFCDTIKYMKIQNYYNILDENNNYYCVKCGNKKKIQNNLNKYNVENVFQLDSVKLKSVQTLLSKYNCSNIQQNEDYHNKTLLTNNIKYGFDNPSKSPEIIQKIKDTHFDKYGSWFSQTDEYNEKVINTNNEKFGEDYFQYTDEFITKSYKTAFKIDYYNEIKYQGSYELDFIKTYEYFFKYLSKPLIIEYYINDKKHIYHPDFFFEKYNLIIEIKSSYTYKLHKEKCDAKKIKCLELNYNYLLIIDKDYNEFDTFLKNNNKTEE